MTFRGLLKVAVATIALLAAAPAAAGVQYYYDSAGRLIKAVYSNGITVDYRYDAAGNRIEIATSSAPNHAPVAVNDTASVATSGVVDISVRANDSDVDGNTLTITGLGTPSGGSAAIMAAGTYVRYTAPATAGAKTFTYTISDGVGGTASATVTVTVTSPAAPPVAEDDFDSVMANHSGAIFVLANDTDPNGDTLTVTAISNLTGGSASIASGGGYINYFAPSTVGSYSFDYTVSDGHGGTDVGHVDVNVSCDTSGGEMCTIE